MRQWLALVALLAIAVGPSTCFQPRRIMFARCSAEEKMPRAVFMSCANRRGVCEVRIGSTHNLRAIFIPDYNSTNVDSHVRWNSWFEVPLPGQDRDACDGEIDCPVIAGEVTRFTYVLDIQEFWPRNEYPVIWTLTDRATDETLVCFKFKINIV
ncbi:uncharacterized protein LOC119583339 [Penaeus monodon]|uniref:ML1 protein n=1 Tax=Penaeus monodon TaxID=6687 RepID=A0A977J6C7_PENMO|nr:uncharacterized protein LOC119583339 [Penaeus monodon]XP_037787750.1 uncharacterized protein LOC119583339 [Penaeus monodon]XP_037787756.1 uncharacterized protein LOC119583339 [Penaeus monodon]UWX08111.1 ML1 protein [Penaeus monodon]